MGRSQIRKSPGAEPAAALAAGMQSACIPADEADRLATLRNLNLLDTPPSASFDRITRLAAALLDVPTALVSLVDAKRQWFKSKVGLNATETPREISFCAHAVFERRPLVVPDVLKDPRFAGNPLVTGPPHIRAYLGVPIFSRDGFALGTLCAIDSHPHEFDDEDLRRLKDCVEILEESLHAQEAAKSVNDVMQFATEREQLYRDTFERAAVGMTHMALDGRLMRVNQYACEMLGYTALELQGMSFLDITHPDDIPRNLALVQRLTAGEIDSFQLEKRLKRKDGSYFWIDVSSALKRSASGHPDYTIDVIRDIAAKKHAQAELMQMRDSLRSQVTEQTARLQQSNDALQVQVKKVLESEREVREAGQRARAIANNIPALIGYWSNQLRCEFANEMYRSWFGIDPLQVVGMNMPDLLGAEQFDMIRPHARLALEGQAQRFETCSKAADGADIFREVRYIPEFAASGDVAGFYVLGTDVTQSRNTQQALEAANQKLTTDSVTDYLTGLSNRRVFSQRSEEASRRFNKYGEPYGLILLDLDNFKQINDRHGHNVGDEVLRVVGRLLKNELRSHRDIAARLGGEEFAILCFVELNEELLRVVAERLRTQINQEAIHAPGDVFHFTASLGLALSDPADADWKNIYARADAALYEAKAAGKNRVAFSKASVVGTTGKFRAERALQD